MTDLRVTADTNILASGAPSADPDVAPARFVAAWRAQRFTLILSDHMLDELERALAKPYFVQRLSEEDRQRFRGLLHRKQ